jgi:hypothetical protein
MASIQTFVTENEDASDRYRIQWQFRDVTVDCVASDLVFARRIINFVADTRGNPSFRDAPLGGGASRKMPDKRIDLSSHFMDIKFEFWKLGEYDHAYLLRIALGKSFWISTELHERELDDFLDGLRGIAGS